jgi:hypothetical protein
MTYQRNFHLPRTLSDKSDSFKNNDGRIKAIPVPSEFEMLPREVAIALSLGPNQMVAILLEELRKQT